MSISHGSDYSNSSFPTYDPYRPPSPPAPVWMFNCRQCGYEPEDRVVAPRLCPKCGGSAFERVSVPRALLDTSERFNPPGTLTST